MWSRLCDIFGQKFSNNYGERPNPTWEEELSRLTDVQLQRGIQHMKYEGGSYAPSLSDFLKACRAGGDANERCCPWPIFNSEPVGISELSLRQREDYKAGNYDNVPMHRVWICGQEWYSPRKAGTPEEQALKVWDSGQAKAVQRDQEEPDINGYVMQANTVLFNWLRNYYAKGGKPIGDAALDNMVRNKNRLAEVLEQDKPTTDESAAYLQRFYSGLDKIAEARA